MILIVHRLAWNKSAFKGIKKNIYILAELARNWILQLIYGFDRWHVVCGYHRVEYKKALIEKINSKEYEVVLEGNFWPSVLPNGSNWCGPAFASCALKMETAGEKKLTHSPSTPPPPSLRYDVPFKAMTPKAGTGTNLLVPVCLSASAVAYSSTRIENMFMSLGAAAGVAAKQLVDGDVDVVQAVDVSKVQAILTATFQQRIHGPPA